MYGNVYVMLHTLQLQGNVLAEGGVGVLKTFWRILILAVIFFIGIPLFLNGRFFIVPITERLAPNMQNEDVVRLQQRLRTGNIMTAK